MGTNYYLRTNICKCCGRYDEVHIGKSSAGWTFSFQGFRDEYNTLKRAVKSYKEWLEILPGGEIFDECGEKLSLDEFKKLVEGKRPKEWLPENLNHTTYCRINHPEYARECWLDEEGNSFSSGEFS
jgi:hypothetical protein